MRWLRRLHYWLNLQRMEDALREETETHLAMRAAALAERGEADPIAGSRRAFGNAALARDDARDVWSWPWLDGLIRDAKFTLRSMRRRPGFAGTCVATVAVGTGALASVLSVVHVVLLGAPPYQNHARIVQIAQVSDASGRLLDEVSAADVLALRQHGGAIEDVTTAWSSSVSLSGGSLPERAHMVFTDSRAFAMLGTPPEIGRLPSVADEAPEAPPVVMIGHALWAQQFDSDAMVLGRPLKLGGAPAIGRQIRVLLRRAAVGPVPLRRIIGVYPDIKEKTIYEPTPPTVYLPVDARDATRMAVLVRTDRPVGEMRQAMRAAIASVDPEQAAFGFMTLDELIGSELSLNALSLRLLGSLGAVALLLAVIGVYGVMAQAVRQRTREIAIRLALGVTPAAVKRLLVRECALLVAGGFLAGGAAALWAARVLRSLVYGIHSTSPLTFATAAALLAVAVLAGCYVPARRAAQTDPALVLRGE